jgi:cytochrome P450
LLSQYPKITGDLVDELNGVLHGDSPAVEQLAQLPLLERVIKESMRLLPPAPVNMRITVDGCELGGYHIPPNTEILASAYRTHRIPELYPEPYVFNPDRWLRIDPSPYEYHAFGAGPRMCIGAPFAMMEIKIILATLLQRYRLQMVPNAAVDRYFGVTMSPKAGMPMTVQAQDGKFAEGVVSVGGNVREMVTLPN